MKSRPAVARVVAFSLLLLGSACSDDEPEQTAEELLAEIEGRTLTPEEIDQRQEVAELLCVLDDEVLLEIWSELDAPDLAFQDYVFTRVCQDRNALYGQATGRFTTGETGDDDS